MLGTVTDTWDIEGKVIKKVDNFNISKQEVVKVLKSLIGDFNQIPPIYSAKKIKGKPAYYYLRNKNKQKDISDISTISNVSNISGIYNIILQKKSTVKIFDIKLISYFDNKLLVKINCSSGTYIRSIAFEIGEKLGCGATLLNLIRSKVGNFDVSSCVSVEDFINDLLKLNSLYAKDLAEGISDLSKYLYIEKSKFFNKSIFPLSYFNLIFKK